MDKLAADNLAHVMGDEKDDLAALEHKDVDYAAEMAGHIHFLLFRQIFL